MCGATLLFEGSAQEVREQERQVYEIASLYGGMKAGAVSKLVLWVSLANMTLGYDHCLSINETPFWFPPTGEWSSRLFLDVHDRLPA